MAWGEWETEKTQILKQLRTKRTVLSLMGMSWYVMSQNIPPPKVFLTFLLDPFGMKRYETIQALLFVTQESNRRGSASRVSRGGALSWNLRNRNFSAEIRFLEPQRVKRSCGYLEGLQNGEEIHHWDMVWGPGKNSESFLPMKMGSCLNLHFYMANVEKMVLKRYPSIYCKRVPAIMNHLDMVNQYTGSFIYQLCWYERTSPPESRSCSCPKNFWRG